VDKSYHHGQKQTKVMGGPGIQSKQALPKTNPQIFFFFFLSEFFFENYDDVFSSLHESNEFRIKRWTFFTSAGGKFQTASHN
jgi:hypothetical protein